MVTARKHAPSPKAAASPSRTLESAQKVVGASSLSGQKRSQGKEQVPLGCPSNRQTPPSYGQSVSSSQGAPMKSTNPSSTTPASCGSSTPASPASKSPASSHSTPLSEMGYGASGLKNARGGGRSDKG
ncbi:MAG: hypothetical protein GY822_12980 [Deltaproteobacteria bacterium]|nr:hypothetical protein [Deltaproteobacteria bacterium]